MANSIGKQADDLQKMREKIRVLDKQITELKREYNAKLDDALEHLESQGLDGAQGKLATISISESERPSVKDWDEFHRFIRRTNKLYLLERRPAVAAYRELLATRRGKPVPGVETFTKKTLNVRTRDK